MIKIAVLACFLCSVGAYFIGSHGAREIKPDPQKLQEYLDLAANVLVNCLYLRKNFPERRQSLFKLFEKPISVVYEPEMENKFFAIASPPQGIRLGPAFYTDTKDDFSREEIIAHEMLHLAGFPPHKLDKQGNQIVLNDAVYVVISQCYAGISL